MPSKGSTQRQAPVVAEQPKPSTEPENQREWNIGLFNCREDKRSTAIACFCPLCFMAKMAKKAGEREWYLFCCYPNEYLSGIRTKIRTQHGIKGSVCNDIFKVVCCPCCSMVQMWRELEHIEGGQQETAVQNS